MDHSTEVQNFRAAPPLPRGPSAQASSASASPSADGGTTEEADDDEAEEDDEDEDGVAEGALTATGKRCTLQYP